MLNTRQKDILNRVILLFEKTLEPVGSKAICDEMGLSSATIRNEMSELSRLGYLEQPHTSAGRIPSHSAYRLYIDELLRPVEPTETEKNHIYNAVFSAGNPEIVLRRACDALSDVTEQMCITSTPSDANSYISKVELIPIGSRNFLLVLLTDSGIVKSHPLRVDEDIHPAEAAAFSASCAALSKTPMINIDKGVIQGLFSGVNAAPLKFAAISDTLRSLIESACSCTLIASGEINLFSRGEIEIEKARKILSLLRNEQTLLDLLLFPESHSSVLIGTEMKQEALNTSSLVFDDYSFLDRKGGKIGVIGSTRMQYSRILPIVRFTAETVGNAISNLFRNDGRNIYVQIR